MKQFSSSIRLVLGPLVLLMGLTIAALWLGVSQFSAQKEFETNRSKQLAELISNTLIQDIQNQIALLSVLAEGSIGGHAAPYDALARVVTEKYPVFFAVNLVDADGTIQKVFPVEPNRAAFGKNILSREDVGPYFNEARNAYEPRMTHRVMTYQGKLAFILYVPIGSKANRSKYTLNGVIDWERSILKLLQKESAESARIRVSWPHPQSIPIELGEKSTEFVYSQVFQILNQKVTIDVGFLPSQLQSSARKFSNGMLCLGLILLLFVWVLVLQLLLSKYKLTLAHSHLALNSSLLSALTHDVSNLVSPLKMKVELATKQEFSNAANGLSIASLFARVEALLRSGRRLHATRLGIGSLKLLLNPLVPSIREMKALVQESAHAKKVKINFDPGEGEYPVLSEKVMLENCVLLNVLTNAVKFSAEGGTIHITLGHEGNQVVLKVRDHGCGFSAEELNHFRKHSSLPSKHGTLGESGTGLGLLQIKTFMEAFKGRLELGTHPDGGAEVILCFATQA